MRGVGTWAVACRKPAADQLDADGHRADMNDPPRGEIAVETHQVESVLKRHRWLRVPIVRGVVALGESLVIGFKALGTSANAQMPEEEEPISGFLWTATIIFALALSVGLFFIVPVTLTNLIKDQLGSAFLFWIVEGVLRTGIFLGYLILISRMRDLRRVFEYHGAEHKTISCYEAELELTPAERQELLAPAPPLRYELPADRDDRRDLRLLPARAAALVGADRHPHRRRAADRRHLLRAHQARRQAPPPPLGPDPHVARASSSSCSRPASPTSPSSPSRSPRWRPCSRMSSRATRSSASKSLPEGRVAGLAAPEATPRLRDGRASALAPPHARGPGIHDPPLQPRRAAGRDCTSRR